MKTFKNLFCLTFIILSFYSCEPEELPTANTSNAEIENLSADTGNQADDVQRRGDDD